MKRSGESVRLLAVHATALVVLLLTLEGTGPADASTTTAPNFDFLFLVQQWGPGFCATENQHCEVPSGTNWWTLHGLWPNNNDTTYPSSCNSSYPFNPNEIAPVRNQLNMYWTNYLVQKTADSFWAHEWEKHGTCAAAAVPALDTELKFFSQTLKLRSMYPVSTILSSSNIYPSNSKKYASSDIITAFRSQLSVTPVLGCEYAKHKGADLLTEIGLCISKSTLTVFECDPRVVRHGLERSCDENFLIPTTA